MVDWVLNRPLHFEILLWSRVLKVFFFFISYNRLSSEISSNIVFQHYFLSITRPGFTSSNLLIETPEPFVKFDQL